jgi:hypothetical protein
MSAEASKAQYSPEFLRLFRLMRILAHDFIRFVSRYCYIQDRKSGGPIRFELWPGQAEVTAKLLSAKLLAALKARQLGITWLIAAYCLWRSIFRANELIIVISAKEDLAVEFLDRVKYMFDRLPGWLRPPVLKRTTTELSFGVESRDAKGDLVVIGHQSTIKSIPSTPDAGQSKTISLLVMDETALNRYCKEIWGSAKPTLEHASGQAVIISNPSKVMPGWPWTRQLCTDALKGLNDFELMFLGWQCVPGRGDDFIERQKQSGLDDDDISMQYPSSIEEALSTLGSSYFGKTLAKFETIDGEIGTLRKSPGSLIIGFEPDSKGILEVWEHPVAHWEQRYAIGSDVAEGLGGDYSVAYVLDRVDQRFVARMRTNKVSADMWAGMLADLGAYYHDAMVGPERNGAGITTVIKLQELYQHLFYRTKPGTIKGEFLRVYGWQTTNESKQILVDELKRYYREVFDSMPCAYLLDESSTFIRNENGQLGAEDGHHDDCVIAAGITLQVSMAMSVPKDVTPRGLLNMAVRDWARIETSDTDRTVDTNTLDDYGYDEEAED